MKLETKHVGMSDIHVPNETCCKLSDSLHEKHPVTATYWNVTSCSFCIISLTTILHVPSYTTTALKSPRTLLLLIQSSHFGQGPHLLSKLFFIISFSWKPLLSEIVCCFRSNMMINWCSMFLLPNSQEACFILLVPWHETQVLLSSSEYTQFSLLDWPSRTL
jgi:hypothetical protein